MSFKGKPGPRGLEKLRREDQEEKPKDREEKEEKKGKEKHIRAF